TGSLRLDLRQRHHFSLVQDLGVYGDSRTLHGLRLHESRLGYCSDRGRALEVGVAHIGRLAIVIDVRDVGVVDDGVGDVDPREILAADRVRGPIDFARSKRKPTDRTAAAHRYAEVASADERDKRGRVHGSLPRRTRHPAPTLLDERPAT